jgi:hypothetical protein
MAEEGGDEGTSGATADISDSCSTSTGVGTGGPCSTPPPRRSAAPARLLHCARRCRAFAPPAPPTATHGAVLCQHGSQRGLPRRAACRCGRYWLPRPRLAIAVGQRRPGGAAAGQRRGGGGTKKGRQLGFGRRSHRFIYRRAKWARWAVGPSC